MKTWNENRDRIEGGEIVSPKLDGIYARATAGGMVTKSGKPITTQPGVWKRLAAHFRKNPQASVEGELYRDGQPFQQTVSDFKRGRGLDYHVFPSEGPKPRRGGGIFHVRGEKVRDSAGADASYRKAQAAGYEGVVIRKADGTLLKRKPMQDSEYRITGGRVGKKHGVLSVTDGKRSFRVQAPAEVAANAPVGKLATIGYFRKTLLGKPHAPVFKAVRDYEASSRAKEIFMSEKQKKGMSPYLRAALSGGVSGAALGFVPILKNGVKLRTALKSAAVTGAASAGVVGGGSLLGSKIIGEPKEGENSPFLKRAALGGAIAGTGLGIAGAILAKKNALVKSGISHLAKEWRPAAWMQKSGTLKASAIGAVAGGGVGALTGSDEGAQVDTLNSMMRNNEKNMKKKQFSVGGKTITFAREFVQEEGGVPLTGKVARDRFIKKVSEDDLRRRDKNMIRTTGIGAVAGALYGGKRGILKRAVIGGSAGLVSVPLVRAITNRSRDVYGERTHEGKMAEHVPAVAGVGASGYLAYKLLKNKFHFEDPLMSQVVGGRAMLDKKRDHMDNIRDAALVGTGGAMTAAAIHQTAMIRDLDKTSRAAAKSIEAAKNKVAKKAAKVSRFFAPGLGKKSNSPIIRIGRKLIGLSAKRRLVMFEEQRNPSRVRDFLKSSTNRAVLTGAGLVTGGWLGAVGGKEVARRVANATGKVVKKGEKLHEGAIVWRRGNDPLLGAINHYGVADAKGRVRHFSPKGIENHTVGRFAKKNDVTHPVYRKEVGSKRIGDADMYKKKKYCFVGRNCQDAAQRLAGHQFPIWEDQVGSAIAGAAAAGTAGAYLTNKAANNLKKKHEFASIEQQPQQPQKRQMSPAAMAAIAGGVTLGGVGGVMLGRAGVRGVGKVVRSVKGIERGVQKGVGKVVEGVKGIERGVNEGVGRMKNTTAVWHDVGAIYQGAKNKIGLGAGFYNLMHPIQTARETKAAFKAGLAGKKTWKKAPRPSWAMASRGRLLAFSYADQPRLHKKYGENGVPFAPILGSLARNEDLVDAKGAPFQMTNGHVIRAAMREGQKYRVGTQRTYRVGRDLSDVIQGKPKEPGRKREWEKAWVGNALTAAAIGASALGVVGLRRYARMPGNKGKWLSKTVLNAEDEIASAKDTVVSKVGDFVNGGVEKMGLKEAGSAVARSKNAKRPKVVPGKFSSLQKQIQFDIWAQERGWDLRDARGKSARVFAPGSQRRQRRLADWKETKEGQRKLLIGAGIGGGLAATAIGSTIAYKLGGRGAMKHVGVLENKLANAARAKKAIKTRKANAGVRSAFVQNASATSKPALKAV